MPLMSDLPKLARKTNDKYQNKTQQEKARAIDLVIKREDNSTDDIQGSEEENQEAALAIRL